MKTLLVGVRCHGGEEVYSSLLRDHPPPGVAVDWTFDFHRSCAFAHCRAIEEIFLNRIVHPFLRFNMGFRVLDVGPDPDLVHIHTHPTILHGLRARPVVFSAGSSHYHYVRDYEGWSQARIDRVYSRARPAYRALGVLDALLSHERITLAYTFSSWARQAYLDHGVPPSKIRVIHPGFPVPEAVDEPPQDSTTFLFMGRQPRRKGGDLVLAAFEELYSERRDVRLLYVSDEQPVPVPPGVEVSDLVLSGEAGRLYRRANVFLNPTLAEGFGFTNIEAQGYGLPVVSTRIAAIPEVVEHGVTGLLLEPGDFRGLLEAMRTISKSFSMRREMGLAARSRFEKLFALRRFQAGLLAIYEEAAQAVR